MKKPLKYDSPKTFALIPQEGVKTCRPNPEVYTTSNCCWDATLSPDGIFYLSLGSEGGSGNFAYLNYYDREENDVKTCFYSKDYFLPHERAMPGSKFHSCIDFLPDGRVICCNHNTDKAPSHPEWLPYAYFSHPWESYPGSNVFIYDPKTGFVENCGVPAPKESLYGGVYSKKNNAFYAIGFQRGHLYKFDLTTRETTDLGKGIETCSHRLHIGPDENVYYTSPAGWFSRVNTDTDKIEWLGIRLPDHKSHPMDKAIPRYITSYFNLDSDRMLIMDGYADQMLEYNIRTNELIDHGELIACGEFYEGFGNVHYNFSGALDKDNVLWYSVSPRPKAPEHDQDRTHPGVAYLLRWDVLRGGEQELIGVIGTPGNVLHLMSEFRIDKEKDILYGTCSAGNPPLVVSIDLAAQRRNFGTMGPEHNDPKFYPKKIEKVDESQKVIQPGGGNRPYEGSSLTNKQEAFAPTSVTQVRIWTELKDDLENCPVIGLYWVNNDVIRGVCGKDEPKYGFEIHGDKVTGIVPLETMDEATRHEYLTKSIPAITDPGVKLPHVAGRQYLAVPSASAAFSNGRTLYGTKDGMLAMVNGEDVFALGLTSSSGPVRSICTNADRTVAWGTCGDLLDHGRVFRYDDKRGLQDMGLMYWFFGGPDGIVSADVLSCIATAPDDKRLALGSFDMLGTVFLAKLDD